MDKKLMQKIADALYKPAGFDKEFDQSEYDEEEEEETFLTANAIEVFDVVLIEVNDVNPDETTYTYYVYDPHKKHLREVNDLEDELIRAWTDQGLYFLEMEGVVNIMVRDYDGLRYFADL